MNSKSVEICGINTSMLPKINSQECVKLLKEMKNGNEKAKEKLIMANMRLVLSVIKKFNNPSLSKDDLFQAGCLGLIKAATNFDLSVGVKFSTYAVPMIIGEVKRCVRQRNSLRVPRSIRDTAYKVLKMRNQIEREDKEATNEEIARQQKKLEKLNGEKKSLEGRINNPKFVANAPKELIEQTKARIDEINIQSSTINQLIESLK